MEDSNSTVTVLFNDPFRCDGMLKFTILSEINFSLTYSRSITSTSSLTVPSWHIGMWDALQQASGIILEYNFFVPHARACINSEANPLAVI